MFNIFNLFHRTNNEEKARRLWTEQVKTDGITFKSFDDASLFYLNLLKELMNVSPKDAIPKYDWKGRIVTVPELLINTLSTMRNGYQYKHLLLELEEFWETNTKLLAVKDHILLMEFQAICRLPRVAE